MEKSGSLVLSLHELKEIQSGQIPDRIVRAWGLTLDELTAMIQSGQYTLTGNTSVSDAE